MLRQTARLVLATRNAHKAAEISRLLEGSGVECAALDAYPGVPEVEEDLDTLEGNAAKKAEQTARACGTWALADDTGLEVAALNGAPGVFSARWAGHGCSYADNCAKLLRELSDVPAPRRAASFRTVMALSGPDGRVETVEGRLDGTIASAPRGTGGFGYDPLFLLPDGRTLAQLGADEKNALSHRGRALREILPRLKALALGAVLSLLVADVSASKTEPGQETIWDQIMAAQAQRGLRQGHRYLEEKKYDLAMQEIKRAVAGNPKDPLGRLLLGVAQYWSGAVDESIASYQAALALDPGNAQGHLLLGISHAWQGDASAAEAEFHRAVELDPARADAQMNLGSIRETFGDYPGALERFRLAVDLEKRNPLYRFQLGSLYRKLGRDADALEQFREAVKIESSYEDAMLEMGCAQERLKDAKGAIATLRRAVDLKPGDSVARMRLSRLYLAVGRPRKARAILAEAFHLTPEEGGSGLQLSVAYASGRKPASETGGPAGSAEPEPAVELEPADPLSLFERNLRRVPLEQAAVMHMDAVFLPRPKLLKEGPKEGSSLRRALARAGAGGDDAAPRAVRRDFILTASDAVAREKQVADIMGEMRQVMREAPPEADARLGMNLTFTRPVDAGRSDGAAPSKVSYQPRQVGNDMGLWVIGTGWMALVAEVLPEPGEKAAFPEDADGWTAIGLAHATVGEGQRAMEAFLNATRLDLRSVPAWLGRGVAGVMTGDDAGAVSALRTVLAIDPKNKAANDGLKWLLRPAQAKETPKK
ncbi:MAG: non-canonical purine NTP pyrophosphatase, RdgB/HAM1 family [Elusimicrobia bacterium GWA2_66_18]|nr:MAG: non-canonical purine NTP pyrophosphatase, RdgB/HAM1 family [Elusimicrobia bacterium GWA2_66_18]